MTWGCNLIIFSVATGTNQKPQLIPILPRLVPTIVATGAIASLPSISPNWRQPTAPYPLSCTHYQECRQKSIRIQVIDAYRLLSIIVAEVSSSPHLGSRSLVHTSPASCSCPCRWWALEWGESFTSSAFTFVGIVSLGDSASYDLVRPILESCSPDNLRRLEDATPVSLSCLAVLSSFRWHPPLAFEGPYEWYEWFL